MPTKTVNTIKNELKRGKVLKIKCNKTIDIYFSDNGQTAYKNNHKIMGVNLNYLMFYFFWRNVKNIFLNFLFLNSSIKNTIASKLLFLSAYIFIFSTLVEDISANKASI